MTMRELMELCLAKDSGIDLDEEVFIVVNADYICATTAQVKSLPVVGKAVVILPEGSPIYEANGSRWTMID